MRKLPAADVRRIRELRYGDGLTAREVAPLIGCSEMTVCRYAPGRIGKVPVAPLREAFLRSGLTAAEVGRRVGWLDRGYGDSSKVKRYLGLNDDVNGNGKRCRRTLIDAEHVERIAYAIGVMPWEVLPDDEQAAA